MEKSNIETRKEKPYFYACCPMCKRMLLQSANGADCYIKCVQCGSRIHITIQDGVITTKKED